jgi:hypothetical protein
MTGIMLLLLMLYHTAICAFEFHRHLCCTGAPREANSAVLSLQDAGKGDTTPPACGCFRFCAALTSAGTMNKQPDKLLGRCLYVRLLGSAGQTEMTRTYS